jgi:acyl transferase domain-containing protein/acyl carrier protein
MWDNIVAGRNCLTRHETSKLADLGVSPRLLGNPSYVPVSGILEGIESFDADYFGFSNAEAPAVNPQLRTLLELSAEALADGGLSAQAPRKRTGVFLSCTKNKYGKICLQHRGKDLRLSIMQIGLLNKADYVATQVAYRLDLKGPAMIVQCACSSSLVAVHLACQALRADEADICLAGGISIKSLMPRGYLPIEGTMLSPSGVCRPFDNHADGTIFADGGGVIALMRLDDAIAGGHRIYASLIGSAVNNDGYDKLGFVAPSAEGQEAAYAAALWQADIDPASIAYIETHGTGTRLGDPIEVEALHKVYGRAASSSVALGAIKSNIGHLDAGAGVVGLIKTSLAMHHGKIPPNASFLAPTSKVDWDRTPFYLPTTLSDWQSMPGRLRRAAVTALGIGGTNAHVILEEAPAPVARDIRTDAVWPIPISSHSAPTLKQSELDIGDFLRSRAVDADAVSRAMCTTRPTGVHRSFGLLRVTNGQPACDIELTTNDDVVPDLSNAPHIFLFPGQESQIAGMGIALYERFPLFARHVEAALSALEPEHADLIRHAYYVKCPSNIASPDSNRTDIVQPGLLAFQFALAMLLRAFGITPSAMIGHSLGEISCAAVGGGFAIEDAMRIAAIRGRQCEQASHGAMLIVIDSFERAADLLKELPCDLAADNSARQFVLSGSLEAIVEAEQRLNEHGFLTKLFNTRYGFHSAQLDDILPAFRAETQSIRRLPSQIPYISGLTGSWITEQDFVSPNYLTGQLRHTVRFRQGIAELHAKFPNAVFWEVGPGSTLTTFGRAQSPEGSRYLTPFGAIHEDAGIDGLLTALGLLWKAGVHIDWETPLELVRYPISPLPAPAMLRRRHWLASSTMPAPVQQTSQAGLALHEPTAKTATDAGDLPSDLLGMLCTIWKDALSLPDATASTDFFHAGGDSLQAIQLVSLIKSRCGAKVHPSQIYQYRTPAAMFDRLQQLAGGKQKGEAPATDRIGYEISPPEQWMLSWAARSQDVALFNVVSALRVDTPLDPEKLAAALERVLHRQSKLRQTIRPGASTWELLPLDQRYFTWIDRSHAPEDERERAVAAVLAEKSRVPIKLDGNALFHLTAIRLGAAEHVLVTCSHHIVWDGWSLTVFWKNLFGEYADRRPVSSTADPGNADIPEEPLDRRQEAEQYWKEKLKSLPAHHLLPSLAQRPEGFTFEGTGIGFTLDQQLTGQLKEVSRRRHIPLATILLAAYAASLSEVMRLDSVWVRLPVTNRTSENNHRVGFFLHTVVCQLTCGQNAATYLAHVQQELENALRHQAIEPLALMNMASENLPKSFFSPFQYEFNHHMYVPRVYQGSSSMRTRYLPVRSETTLTKCDIGFESSEQKTGINVSLVGYRPVVSQATLGKVKEIFLAFLSTALPALLD